MIIWYKKCSAAAETFDGSLQEETSVGDETRNILQISKSDGLLRVLFPSLRGIMTFETCK